MLFKYDDIGILDATPFPQTFSDSVGLEDRDDFYHVDLLTRSNFTLNLSGLSANADVFLGDTTNEVNVAPNELQFNLNQSNNSLNPTDAWVCDENGSDDLNKVDFWVLNPQGEWTDLSDVTNFTPWSGDDRWGSFNYSLDLSQYSGGNYTLWAQAYDKSGAASNAVSQTFQGNILADGAGNTLATAREIGLLDAKPFSQTFSDRVGPADKLDYYRFELLSNSEFQLTLDSLTADANVFLLDFTGKTINYSVNKNSAPESLTQSLNSGTYYILVRPNRNIPTAATNYNLTISAQYIVDDLLVSDPKSPLLDPEFDSSSNQLVWQSNEQNNNGLLQVAHLDPESGSLILDPASITVLDNGVPSFKNNGNNGPEWGYGDSLKITYNKEIDGKIFLRQAEWTGTEWTTDFIVDSQGNPIEGISTITHQDPNFGLVSYLTTMKISGQPVEVSAWADLDTPGVGGILPGERRRWVEGEQSILLTQEIGGYEQLFKYEVDSGKLTQLTFDPIDKVGDAYMFRAPQYNNELIFMVAETTIDNNLTANQFSIYRQLNGQWTKIKTVVSPVPDLPIVIGQQPFSFNGQSYISFSISKGDSKGVPIYDGNQQVWFSSVGIEKGDDLLRRVSSDQGTTNSRKVPDPEPFVTQDNAFIYYTTSEVAGGVPTIHRTDTGLGADTGLVMPVISDFPSLTGTE